MPVPETIEEDDTVAVVEVEEVVVEGVVIDLYDTDEGTVVEIRESDGSIVEYWEADTGASVTLGRQDGSKLKPIPVADIARIEPS